MSLTEFLDVLIDIVTGEGVADEEFIVVGMTLQDIVDATPLPLTPEMEGCIRQRG